MLMQQKSLTSGGLNLNTASNIANISQSRAQADENISASTPQLMHWAEIVSTLLYFASVVLPFILCVSVFSSPPWISLFFLVLLVIIDIGAVIFGRIARQRI